MPDSTDKNLATGHQPGSLFDVLPKPERNSTQTEGEIAACLTRDKRFRQIKELLQEHKELALWELANFIGVHPHQISGRISELLKKGEIEKTGDRRRNPETRANGNVYRLALGGEDGIG